MANYDFTINGVRQRVEDIPEWLPMLWVLRDKLGITGPKYGCGVGACRACTCHLIEPDGSFTEFQPCITAAEDIGPDQQVRTIEGLGTPEDLHPVQQAWLELDVPQCGFCQPGQIMTATALIAEKGGEVTDDDIDQIDNVCRCGTYARIRNAIKVAADNMDVPPPGNNPGNGNGDNGNGNGDNGNGNGGNGRGNNANAETNGDAGSTDSGRTDGGSSTRDPDTDDSGSQDDSGGLLGGVLGS